METLIQDFNYGIRMLNKHPGVSLMVVVILALGIADNSAIFTLINDILLEPLPYVDANRLVAIRENRATEANMVSGPEFISWSQQNKVFEDTAAITYELLNLTGSGEPESLVAAKVSAG